jgi:heptosyltransferase III
MPGLDAQRILIYRLGSIGDFVVSLPCLHLIRRNFPAARICLLTSREPDSRAATAETVLSGSGLVDSYIEYSLQTRRLGELQRLRKTIRQFGPDLFVYLAGFRGVLPVWRDYLFFRGCGIGRSAGFPFTRDLQQVRPPASEGGLWEREAHRLGRCLTPLGAVDVERPENWDLRLTASELAAAKAALGPLITAARPAALLSFSLGTKQAINDWGDQNWRAVLAGLSDPRFGLVLIGAEAERVRSEEVARSWSGPSLNLCGRLSPRISAAVMAQTRVLLCHDSGPLHLAAAVATPCVAVFSKLNPPGKWFPYGNHQIFYPPVGADSIEAIRPAAVCAGASALIQRSDISDALPFGASMPHG